MVGCYTLGPDIFSQKISILISPNAAANEETSGIVVILVEELRAGEVPRRGSERRDPRDEAESEGGEGRRCVLF